MGNMISEELLKKLLNDQYTDIIGFINQDDTLELRFKGNAVAVYYRGLSIADLYVDEVKINKSFCKGEYDQVKFDIKDDWSLIEAIPYLKQNIDFKFYHSSATYETEFSQLIARENNAKKHGNVTDYFILEEEYGIHFNDSAPGDGRFDLVGVHINHRPENRRTKNIEQNKYGIVLVEVKYLEDAYDDSDSTPGIPKHISDFARLFDHQNQTRINEMARDLEEIFSAKRELGLLPGLSGDVKCINFSEDPMDMELILALIGHNTNSDHLIELLKDSLRQYPEEITNRIFIAQSSEFGLGLYDKRMMKVKDYLTLIC